MTSEDPDRRRPRSVYGHGEEPDPRFSLANERTFLAWVRTAMALLAAAAAVHLLDLRLPSTVSALTSSGLAVAGGACAASAYVGWARTERALRERRPLPSNVAGVLLVAVVVAACVVMAVLGARG
jgi:putative membrane protein